MIEGDSTIAFDAEKGKRRMPDEIVQSNPKPLPKNRFIVGADVNAYRETLVEQYRERGHKSVLSRVKEGGPEVTSDEILGDIIEEILEGGEDLLGTQLMLAEEGNLTDSTIVTVKRGELLRSVAEIVAKRKELNQRASDIDLNSPAFMLFQKLCFDKMMETLTDLSLDEEMISLIVTKFGEKMSTWGKELKQKLDEMAQ
jgi:uncharacterized protein (UPF0371 family)